MLSVTAAHLHLTHWIIVWRDGGQNSKIRTHFTKAELSAEDVFAAVENGNYTWQFCFLTFELSAVYVHFLISQNIFMSKKT